METDRKLDLITTKDLAGMLGLSWATINRMRNENQLPERITVGRRKYWKAKDIDAWFENMENLEQGE